MREFLVVLVPPSNQREFHATSERIICSFDIIFVPRWLMCSNRRVGADSAYSGPPSPPPPPPQSPSSFNTTDTFVASPAPYNNSGARLLYPDATASSNLKFREFRRLDDPVPNFPAGGQVPAYQIQNQLQNHQFPYQRNHFPWARSDSTERLTEVTSD